MAGALEWGVDSFLPVTTTRYVPGGKTLYDYISDKHGPPAFWGRYIAGNNNVILTRDEAQFLLQKNCRILVIYNGFGAGHVRQGIQAGKDSADKAIRQANYIGVKQYTYIYANLEWDWEPSVDWMLGWWRTMSLSKYGGVGGFYCNPAPVNKKFLNNFSSALAIAEKNIPNVRYMCPLFASGPSKGCHANPKSLTWQAYAPSFHRRETVLWQYAINCTKVSGNKGLYDMDMATARGLRTLWEK